MFNDIRNYFKERKVNLEWKKKSNNYCKRDFLVPFNIASLNKINIGEHSWYYKC